MEEERCGGRKSSKSLAYPANRSPACFRFEVQEMAYPLALELFKAGRSMPARIAMIAITTRSSMSVNLLILLLFFSFAG